MLGVVTGSGRMKAGQVDREWIGLLSPDAFIVTSHFI